MDAELPFRLRVDGKDEVRGLRAISTSFRFHGWLRLEGAALRIDWGGYAQIQDVGVGSVRDDRLPLPTETLLVPATRLRRVELRGAWWRPRLVIHARDPRALALVPSEEQGAVPFWYARGDRTLAAALAASLGRMIAAAPGAVGGPEEIVHLSDSTPRTPPAV